MGMILSTLEVPISEIKSRRDDLKEALLSTAERLTKLTREELVVRDALPKTDLNLANEVWEATISTANNWNDWIDVTLEDQRFLAIYGIAVLSPNPITTGIRFGVGPGPTKVVDVIQFEDILVTENPVGIFEEPIVYKENQYVNIDLYGKATGKEYIALLAMVAEPAGKVTF